MSHFSEDRRPVLRWKISRIKRRTAREKKLIGRIDTKGEDINKRISMLYSKISTILTRVRKNEIEFSKIVDKWERGEIVNNFVPLVHLDSQKKVKARQEEVFEEIWVSKGGEK